MEHMEHIVLEAPEKELCARVRRGETLELEPDEKVRAVVIRRLVLGLPFDRKAGLVATIARFFEDDEASIDSSKTPVGISIKGGVIDARLDLASAVREDGGPICPLEFEGCRLDGGFSGAHGHFSRLCFIGCRFVDPPDENGRPVPTVDLAGALVDGDLDMGDTRPEGVERDSVLPRDSGNHLWIQARGVRIEGEIDLCGSHLRAPPAPANRLLIEEAADALDLTLAEINGDLQFINGARSEGRIKLRAARLTGDVWMSGATIENPGGQALLIQGTRIDGFLMMDGCFDDVGKKRPFRSFHCMGKLKLEASEIGRSLYLEDAVICGEIEAPALSVHDDLIFHAQVCGAIDLIGCRIGGSLDISKLNLASSVKHVDLKDGHIGRTLKVAQPRIPYALLKARWIDLKSLPGLKLVETLWRLVPGETDEHGEEVPVRSRLVQAAFLVRDHDSRRIRVFHLDGHAEVLDRAIGDHGLDFSDAGHVEEYVRLYGAYVLGQEGFFQILSPAVPHESGQGFWTFVARTATGDKLEKRCFVIRAEENRVTIEHVGVDRQQHVGEERRWFLNGLAFPPPGEKTKSVVALEGWLADPPLEGMKPHGLEQFLRVDRALGHRSAAASGSGGSRKRGRGLVARLKSGLRRWSERRIAARLERRIVDHIVSVPLLQARFDLEGLSCDMLDDCGGRAWGEHFDRIRMNHFVYRRANWGSEPRKSASSFRYIWNRIKGARADWLWLSKPGRFTERLRDESDYLEPWQIRRNWIYRHFTPGKLRKLISISRYRMPEVDYRSQPLEQAIFVSRAEGREDIAVRFEMLKSHNEWRFFKERARWWLGPFAITVASLWLLMKGGSAGLTVLAWISTLVMMVYVSGINDLISFIPKWWPRRLAREFLFYLPALSLLFFDWWEHPSNYVMAFLLYVGIRSAGTLSNAVMWWGFGYLRRPVRAIVTLSLVFCLGWWGVHEAVQRDMLVISATPAADRAAAGAAEHGKSGEGPLMMGSLRVPHGPDFVHEPSCAHELSSPLYALDVLIPLVDLNEEARCDIRRLAAKGREVVDPEGLSWAGLWAALPRFPLDDRRFWWWAKAIYEIAGWFLVSLALLTFTQVNRMRGEASAEG